MLGVRFGAVRSYPEKQRTASILLSVVRNVCSEKRILAIFLSKFVVRTDINVVNTQWIPVSASVGRGLPMMSLWRTL